MAGWSDLSNDILDSITDLLLLPDQHRFSAVCHNWRVVTQQKRHPPALELPWLILGENSTHKRNFFSLTEQKHFSIDIPELYGRYICGSSHGWLFTIDKRINGRLVNPFTRAFYELPPFPAFSDRDNVTTYTVEPVFDSEGRRMNRTFDEMQKATVFKAVLSRDPREGSGFIVVTLFGMLREVAFWRPGDMVWTMIRFSWDRDPLSDIIFFEGVFYAVSNYDMLYVVDVGSYPKLTRISDRLFKPTNIPSCMDIAAWRCLLSFKGELLIVQKFQNTQNDNIEFRLLSYSLKEGKLRVLEYIDGLALFVGGNSAVVVDPNKYVGCIKNGIYFTDMHVSYLWHLHGRDFGVYDIVEKSVRRFFPSDDGLFNPSEDSLIWFTHNL